MTRLIDADALKRELMKAFNCEDVTKYGNKNAKQQAHSYSTIMLYEVSDIIEDTIDNAPTVTPDMAQVLAYESGKSSGRKKAYKDLCDTCKRGDVCELSTKKFSCSCRTTRCSQYKRRGRE